MENLKELVYLVNKQKVAKVEVMGNPNNYSGKMKHLYEGIISGKYKTDDEAMIDLYGSDGKVETFKKLKYRLQNRLINTVFFIDVNKPNFNESQRAYYNCQKSVAAVDILLGRGARKTAMELAERTLRQVLKFEYTEMCINLLKKLSRHYGLLEQNKKKFIEYSKLTQKYLEIFNAETVADQLYAKLKIQAKFNAAFSDETINEAISASNQLKKYLDKVESNRFLMFSYLIFANRYQVVNDYKNLIKVCDEALERFEKKEGKRLITVFLFSSLKIDGLIQLKRYEEAETEILTSLKLVPEGKINWFNTNVKYLQMCIHTKEYQKAFNLFVEINNIGFQSIYNQTIETWKIYEAYLHFFIENKKITPSKDQLETGKKFRLNKFLNEVPIFSKDKRGYNIPILIIQVLFLLQKKKYDLIIDKVEALNAYCYRHLKKDDTFRSNCFIKMLLLLPKCNFHRIAVERKSKVLRTKLASVPLEMARQSVEIEIVPYEDLWEIVMDMLEAKFHKSRK